MYLSFTLKINLKGDRKMQTPSFKQLQAPSQSLKQMQRLLMSQEMQQALHFLELPIMELQPLIDQELENNPLLETESEEEEIEEEEEEGENFSFEELKFEERDLKIMEQVDEELSAHINESNQDSHSIQDEKIKNYLESLIREKNTLFSHLMKQSQETFETQDELRQAEELIGNFDERGFLNVSITEISLLSGFSESQLKKVLEKIQTFEPNGIGATNLQESLLLQLRLANQAGSFCYKIIKYHYNNLLNNRIPLIKKELKMKSNEMDEALRQIKKLDLNPALSFADAPLAYIIPDVTIKREENGELQVLVNEDPLPPLRLNRRYLELLNDKTLLTETREFIEKKIMSAKWMLKNLTERNETLARISHLLIKKQKSFLQEKDGKLLPLTMLEIASELNLHESTITRAVSNKYVNTPRGILSLRSFFTHGLSSDLSSTSVKEEIFAIIKNENKKKPLSDASILNILEEKGISCARRTIAKYRKQMGIASTHQRKTF